jgi:uncharacterized protein YjbI with pentapeptide repeats
MKDRHARWLDYAASQGEYSNALHFSHCDLDGVDFSGMDLFEASFYGCSLRGANFADTELKDVKFDDCDLTRADFSGAVFQTTDFDGSILMDMTGLDYVPVLPDIDKAVLAAVSQPDCTLDMDGWHGDNDDKNPCGTTHCRAGWAIHLAGKGRD